MLEVCTCVQHPVLYNWYVKELDCAKMTYIFSRSVCKEYLLVFVDSLLCVCVLMSECYICVQMMMMCVCVCVCDHDAL